MTRTLNETSDFTIKIWNRLCDECANSQAWDPPKPDGRMIRSGTGIFTAIRFALLDADETVFALMITEPQAVYRATHIYRDRFELAIAQHPGPIALNELYFAQLEVTRHLIERVRAEIVEHFGPDV